MLDQRIELLRKHINTNNLDAFLITNSSALRYFLGFTGSSGIGLVTRNSIHFITDFRYSEQAAKEVKTAEIHISKESAYTYLSNLAVFKNSGRTGFESEYLSFQNYSILTNSNTETLISFNDVAGKISSVKSPDEIDCIKKACDITIKVYKDILGFFKTGISEKDIASEIYCKLLRNGSEKISFEPCVLFGKNTSLPHGKPGQSRLKKGDLIQLDFGAVYNGYHADFSRGLIFGKPSKDQREIYLTVLEAQQSAIERVRPGVTANDVDRAARDLISKRGFGEYFGHATGHGIGLNVHTYPRISGNNKDPLVEGNVFTIEPGVYIPGFGGVRIEDIVVVEPAGCSFLTEPVKDIIIL